jgi:hypothetical protein
MAKARMSGLTRHRRHRHASSQRSKKKKKKKKTQLIEANTRAPHKLVVDEKKEYPFHSPLACGYAST